MSERRAISKGVRFEVFKRDGFACLYCGAHPPQVLLEVDHITAVAAGGSDAIENLATACEACNRGKGSRPLSVAPEPLAEKAVRIAEAEEQLREYQRVLQAKDERLEDETWRLAKILGLTKGRKNPTMPRSQHLTIKGFVDRLGYVEVLEAADIALAAGHASNHFRYFCGVCWRKIKNDDRSGRFNPREGL